MATVSKMCALQLCSICSHAYEIQPCNWIKITKVFQVCSIITEIYLHQYNKIFTTNAEFNGETSEVCRKQILFLELKIFIKDDNLIFIHI